MMRISARIGFVALLSIAWIAAIAVAFGQSTDTAPKADIQPKFDVADVHVSAKSPNANQSGGFLRGGRYEIRKGTMVDLVRLAYGVDGDKVLGGPAWLDTDRFDIIAKAPQSTPPDTVKLMLQNLLADRFKLVVHKDTKPLAGYALTVGKGKPKMKEAAEGSANSGCQGKPEPAPPATPMYALVTCRGMTMEVFAQNLRGIGGPYFNNPVVDQTGLKGSWDIDFKFTPRQLLANIGSNAISIFDAVDSQLGMKLDLQKIPTPVIVVDSVNQKPSDNPPGVSTTLPPAAPPEFEVANIKPSMPNAPQMARIQNNRVDAQGLSLKTLVQVAWDITDELMADAPKWMDSANFDVNAKVSTDGSGTPTQFDIDDLRGMLRALLIERFKMKVHMEDRPVSGYVLTAPKPKLQKADPSNRMGCKEGPGADGKDPRIANPILSRLLTCQNMTMARFAELLTQVANGYAHTPVLDSTGLDGAYDFTISFSAIGLVQNAGGRGGDNPAAGVSDPSGALSLPDAVNKQLGLKLEMQKRPMQVLVIDHVEEKPTEN
jgi:uncharacterized protein (TIGR03435 family)